MKIVNLKLFPSVFSSQRHNYYYLYPATLFRFTSLFCKRCPQVTHVVDKISLCNTANLLLGAGNKVGLFTDVWRRHSVPSYHVGQHPHHKYSAGLFCEHKNHNENCLQILTSAPRRASTTFIHFFQLTGSIRIINTAVDATVGVNLSFIT